MDEREEDDSRIGDFDSPLPDKESESSREEVIAKMNDIPVPSPKKKQNPGNGKMRDPAKPRIQDPGGLPRIQNNKSKVNGGTKKPELAKSSPKKLPQLSPNKMARRPKKGANNGELETNDSGAATITGVDKIKDGKKKKPLRKTETSLGLTEQAIKKKVEESFRNEFDNVNNSNELKRRSNNMRSSKSENELNEEDISSLSGSIDLSTPEENSLTIKRKPKKPVNGLNPKERSNNNNGPPSPSKMRKPGGPQGSPSKSKPFPSSPSKMPESPGKRIVNKAPNSPLKSKKKFAKTASQPNFSQNNNNEPDGEKKEEKPWLRSPKKKKVLKKQKSETSIVDADDSGNEKDEKENEESAEPAAPKSPSKKVKKSELVFSDEEQESPFGVSRGVRRTTYLDILKIEHERREAIKKMKEEKEKEREKRRLDETFTKDRQGNKVYSSKSSAASSRSVATKSNASLKSTEPELPEQIEKVITDTVENTAIISSSVNYNRNRESLVSMIKKKIKEDHFIKSLCMTDEWFMKNIIKVRKTTNNTCITFII